MPDVDTGNNEQDDAALLARYMRGQEPGNRAEDWGNLFLRAAQNPVVRSVSNPQPAPSSPATPAAAPVTATPTADNAPPAMGNAFSTAAKALGNFAASTGSNVQPPQSPESHLSQVTPMPKPPVMNPGFAGNETDIRNRSAVTPKYDPATGKTLDKYHEGVGSRIGRAFIDLARGGIPGVVEGAFGNPNDPGYYGKGAVNRQYFRDEAARQQGLSSDLARRDSFLKENEEAQKDYKNEAEWQKDETKRAYEQDVAEERNRHQKESEDLAQQNADIRQQLADAKDPEAKAKAEVKARTAIADQQRLVGKERQRYILYGDKSAMDEYRAAQLAIAEERIGLMQERVDLAKDKAARPSHVKDRQSFEEHWGKRFQNEAEKPYNDARERILKRYGADIDASKYKANERAIQQDLAPYEANREAVKSKLQGEKEQEAGQYGVYNQPAARPQANPSAPAKPAANSDTVRVQKPDGSTGTIPKANAAKAKARGWKILDETPGPQGQ